MFDTLFNVNELCTKKNKERFHMYPHMVNAYYSPVNNEIRFSCRYPTTTILTVIKKWLKILER